MLCIINFASIKIARFDAREVQARDFIVGIVHLSFHMKALVWSMTSRDRWNSIP
jgi:hypothetical protein